MALSVGVVIGNKEIRNEALVALRELTVQVAFELTEIGEWSAFLGKVDQQRPDVVLVELARLGGDLEEGIRRVRRAAGAPAVIVVHGAKDPETILSAMRAGAWEYLCLPLQSGLGAALSRLREERTEQAQIARVPARTTAFLSAKGGCGATSVACHIAVAIQRQAREQVLLADFDLENGMVGFLMKSKSSYSVLDATAGIHRLDLNYWKALVSNGIPGLEVMRAPEPVPSRDLPEHDKLRRVLSFARGHYDRIVLDLGRGLTKSVMSTLEEVEETFLVTTLDVPALHQAQYITRALHDSGYKGDRLRLVLNRVSRRAEVTPEEVAQLVGAPVIHVLSDDHEGLYDAYADRNLLPPENALARQMAKLAGKITGVTEAKKKRSIFG